MRKISVLILLVVIAAGVVADGRHGRTATQVLAAGYVAEDVWLSALANGGTVHVVDQIYERHSVSKEDNVPALHLPDSYTNEFWIQFKTVEGPPTFCNWVSSGAEKLQHSYYDGATEETVTTDDKTGGGSRLPAGKFPLSALRRNVTTALGAAANTAATGRTELNDTSLGRSATVVIVEKSNTGGERVERRYYFDATSGEQFGDESWIVQDKSDPLLMKRLVRRLEMSDAPPPCAEGPVRAGTPAAPTSTPAPSAPDAPATVPDIHLAGGPITAPGGSSGNTFTIEVTGVTSLKGYSIAAEYDESVISITAVADISGLPSPVCPGNSTTDGGGLHGSDAARFAFERTCGSTATTGLPSGTVALVRVTFTCLGSGTSTAISFDSAPGYTIATVDSATDVTATHVNGVVHCG
jgi:hypothetical protein